MSHFNSSVGRAVGKLAGWRCFMLSAISFTLLLVQSATTEAGGQLENANSTTNRPITVSLSAPLSEGGRNSIVSCDWSKDNRGKLTYRIASYPKLFKGKEKEVDELFVRAFGAWSSELYVDFWPKEDGNVTFEIKFVSGRQEDDLLYGGFIEKYRLHVFLRNGSRIIRLKDDEQWSGSSEEETLVGWALRAIGRAFELKDRLGNTSSKFSSLAEPSPLKTYDRSMLMLNYGDCAGSRDRNGTIVSPK